jgi:hypothetical protein
MVTIKMPQVDYCHATGWDLAKPRKPQVKSSGGKPMLQRTLNKSNENPSRQWELTPRQQGQKGRGEMYTSEGQMARWLHLSMDEREYNAPSVPLNKFTKEMLQVQ